MVDDTEIIALVDELAGPLVERFRAELRARLLAAVPPEIKATQPDEWLDTAASAALIGCHPERLRAHRRDGTGPEYERYGRGGRFYRYRRSVLLAWASRNPGRNSGGDGIDGDEKAA